nr:hypothetical protein [Cressdnaviricota sp.]
MPPEMRNNTDGLIKGCRMFGNEEKHFQPLLWSCIVFRSLKGNLKNIVLRLK